MQRKITFTEVEHCLLEPDALMDENDLKKAVKNLGYSLQEPELRDPSDIGLVVAGDD